MNRRSRNHLKRHWPKTRIGPKSILGLLTSKSSKLSTDNKLEALDQKWSEHFSRLEPVLLARSFLPSLTFQTVKVTPTRAPPAGAVKAAAPLLHRLSLLTDLSLLMCTDLSLLTNPSLPTKPAPTSSLLCSDSCPVHWLQRQQGSLPRWTLIRMSTPLTDLTLFAQQRKWSCLT